MKGNRHYLIPYTLVPLSLAFYALIDAVDAADAYGRADPQGKTSAASVSAAEIPRGINETKRACLIEASPRFRRLEERIT